MDPKSQINKSDFTTEISFIFSDTKGFISSLVNKIYLIGLLILTEMTLIGPWYACTE